ncbi:MAG TPA: DUF885 family protein [Bacteroidota bacterium]|nr:DUF885 family protein [Bacteroidota bacterium]
MTKGLYPVFVLALVLPITQSLSRQSEMDTSRSEMRGVIELFQADRDGTSRSYNVSLSPVRSARLLQLYNESLGSLKKQDFEAMSQDGKVDYLLFRNYLNHEIRQLQLQAKNAEEVEPLLPFAGTIVGLEDARRRMDTINTEYLAGLLTRMNKQIDSIQSVLDSARKAADKSHLFNIKKTAANRAASMVNNLKNVLKHWFEYYHGYDPLFTWWVSEPYKAVEENLKNYAEFLREKLAGIKGDDKTTIIGSPIGREGLLSELEYEMIPYTADELIGIANKEFAWCENEMKKASAELGYGADWKKALEYVKTKHVDPGKQPQLVRELALEAIKFVDDNDLVTVPRLARDTWRMEMLTPEQQLQSPFFLGGEVIQVAFPTSTMGHEQKMMSMRGNNIHFARATVFHELIPGHHLQGFMTDRYKPYRGLFSTPFWVEGGALYWETLFWDLGFPKSPENRVGMLFWRMHRCARIIFSLSYHLEKMTPQECIDFLVERVGHERENAAAEVRRSVMGGYGPLYQCAYMLGALQLRALRKELVGTGKMTNRQFHDAVLQENAIPIAMVRASLTKQSLTREHKSTWRFYDSAAGGLDSK